MSQKRNVTGALAQFVADAAWSDIPALVRHEAKRALVNYFAVALSGSDTEPVQLALDSLLEFSSREQAGIIGRSERIDVLSAAFLNAASANVHDYCDTHLPTVIHATAPLAPALFGLSELRPITGEQLLLAFVLGFEIQCRIGLALSPGHYLKGWHITSTCGVFGAAAGVAKLIGLDAQKITWALGNASTQSSGLCECLGWPAKSLSVGNASRNGLWSALLAEKGYEGPAEPLSGVQGFFSAMNEAIKWEVLTNGLGETWEIERNAIKPYPGGFVMHPFIDCVLDWREEHTGSEIERVVLTGNPLLAARTDRPAIATGREAQVSVQHAVAAALVDRRLGVDQFSDAAVNDEAIAALRQKIEIARDASIETCAGTVDIWTADGARYTVATDAARGSPNNPLSDQNLEAKLRVAAEGRIPEKQIYALIDEIWSLEANIDVGKVANLATLRF